MAPEYSHRVIVSRDHALAVDHTTILGSKSLMADRLKVLGIRLVATRQALELTPAELCRRIDCKPNRWSQYETRKRAITLDIANRLCDEFRITLDWIYRADPSGLPHNLRAKIKLAIAA
jgi:DNA-binding XRE family transcriptional regulator